MLDIKGYIARYRGSIVVKWVKRGSKQSKAELRKDEKVKGAGRLDRIESMCLRKKEKHCTRKTDKGSIMENLQKNPGDEARAPGKVVKYREES